LAGRINVIEREESLTFTNLGSFVPGDVQRVVMEDAPEEFYRNRFLAAAMFNLKMVDTAGGGIRKLFLFQKQRFFPMPDYDISDNRVKLTLTSKVLDLDYARLLAKNVDLTLNEIIALDKIQKLLVLNVDEEKLLKAKSLIEGRKPNFFIAKPVAQKTGQKATYSKNRGFEKQYYLDMICKAVGEHVTMTRKDIDELLWNKLPDWMDDKQKRNKVGNLIGELRRQHKIINTGSDALPVWVLVK
jgi:ATP-dependent DNA helicase RecG